MNMTGLGNLFSCDPRRYPSVTPSTLLTLTASERTQGVM